MSVIIRVPRESRRTPGSLGGGLRRYVHTGHESLGSSLGVRWRGKEERLPLSPVSDEESHQRAMACREVRYGGSEQLA